MQNSSSKCGIPRLNEKNPSLNAKKPEKMKVKLPEMKPRVQAHLPTTADNSNNFFVVNYHASYRS